MIRFNCMFVWFDYLMLEWVTFFMPEFIGCMIESCFYDSIAESEPEQIMALIIEADIYNKGNLKTHCVIKDNGLFFDFNLN